MIRDEESGLAERSHCRAYEVDHVTRIGCTGVYFEDQKFPRKAVQQCGYGELPPETVQYGEIKLPSFVDLGGIEQMMRLDTNSGHKRRASVGRPGRFVFTQDALHRPATDLNACSHAVSGNGPCPKLWLGTELAQLMDGPTDRIVNPVPPWAPKQARRITSAIDGLYPVALCSDAGRTAWRPARHTSFASA